MPRPEKVPTTSDMVLAAQLFYIDKTPRKIIASRLHTDLRGVAWLLAQAEKHRIVNFHIHQTIDSDLEHRIKKLYPHVQRVLLVPGYPVETGAQYAELLKRYAAVTAKYFDELLDYAEDQPIHVGVTGGETTLEFVNAVPERIRKNLYIHTTALVSRGRLQKSGSHIEPSVNASILWSRSGRIPGRCEYATVSPYRIEKNARNKRASVAEELRVLAESSPIRDVIHAMDGIDIAFAAIGLVDPGDVPPIQKNRITTTSVLKSIVTLKELMEEGAVADLSYCLFDKDGNSRDDWTFFLSAGHYAADEKRRGLGFFKQMVADGKKVIVPAGPYKLAAIKIGLKAKLFNVLITDEDTARKVADDK